MPLLLIVLLPFLGALLPLAVGRHPRHRALAAALAPLAAFGLLLSQAGAVLEGEVLQARWRWLPRLGLDLALRLDGLGLLFALLILGIGLLIILYARYYMSRHDPLDRLYALLLLFMGSMLGIVLADNLLLLLVFWELTSLASFLLIGFWRKDSEARKGARMALTVTGGGGLALLAGCVLIGRMVGSYDLDVVLASGELIRNHALYPVALVLVLLGAFTKSAQFPFQFWLPHAMSAPTPVSAYLHSATMVKAGVFLLARLYPALAGTELWFYLVAVTGLVTLLYGAYTALFQSDLKGLLAFSTISHLGLITLLFGLGTRLAAVAAVFHIVNHAIFKASLFMAAGIIDHETGTRDIRRLAGLWKYMPHTAALAVVAAASMAGVPLLNGFLSKEMFFSETLQLEGGWRWSLPLAATLASVFSVAYSLRFAHDVFFNGEPHDLPKYPPNEPPRYMKVPVEILVVLCLLVGIAPALTVAPLLDAAAAATLASPPPTYSLAVWHGVNMPLLMSTCALLGGVLLYSQRARLFAKREDVRAGRPRLDAKQVFEATLQRLVRAAARFNQWCENDSLQRYVALLLGAAVVVVGAGLFRLPQLLGEVALSPLDPLTTLAALLLMVATVATVLWHRQRLLCLLMLSAVGLFVAMTFARFSAPDLAMTQITVEVVTIVLMMLALNFLPPQTPAEPGRARHLRDIVLAAVVGVGVCALVLAVLTRHYDPIGQYFLDNAVSGGGGHNVVNVILVDFRGFDTFGEITVLTIAAVGVVALLAGLSLEHPGHDPQGRAWVAERHPLLLVVLSRTLLPLALLVSLYIFLRGHNQPGGGFIAGLVTALALILQYIASGVRWTQRRLRPRYARIAAIGVLLAAATGLGSWWFDLPFLTSAFGFVEFPLIGELEIASAIAFDLGVYLAVVGSTLLILYRLGRLSLPQTDEEAL